MQPREVLCGIARGLPPRLGLARPRAVWWLSMTADPRGACMAIAQPLPLYRRSVAAYRAAAPHCASRLIPPLSALFVATF